MIFPNHHQHDLEFLFAVIEVIMTNTVPTVLAFYFLCNKLGSLNQLSFVNSWSCRLGSGQSWTGFVGQSLGRVHLFPFPVATKLKSQWQPCWGCLLTFRVLFQIRRLLASFVSLWWYNWGPSFLASCQQRLQLLEASLNFVPWGLPRQFTMGLLILIQAGRITCP